MTPQFLLFVLLVIVDVLLWVAVVVAPMSSTARFRAVTAAVFLLGVMCGNVFGWGPTSAVAGLALWVAAIIVAFLPGAASSRTRFG